MIVGYLCARWPRRWWIYSWKLSDGGNLQAQWPRGWWLYLWKAGVEKMCPDPDELGERMRLFNRWCMVLCRYPCRQWQYSARGGTKRPKIAINSKKKMADKASKIWNHLRHCCGVTALRTPPPLLLRLNPHSARHWTPFRRNECPSPSPGVKVPGTDTGTVTRSASHQQNDAPLNAAAPSTLPPATIASARRVMKLSLPPNRPPRTGRSRSYRPRLPRPGP